MNTIHYYSILLQLCDFRENWVKTSFYFLIVFFSCKDINKDIINIMYMYVLLKLM